MFPTTRLFFMWTSAFYFNLLTDLRTEAVTVALSYYGNYKIVNNGRVTLQCSWTGLSTDVYRVKLAYKTDSTNYTDLFTSLDVPNQDEYGFVNNWFGRAILDESKKNRYYFILRNFSNEDVAEYKCTVSIDSDNHYEAFQQLSFNLTGSFNAALNKYTEQSSVHKHGIDRRISSRAVDGNRNPSLSGESCAKTEEADSNWFMVDLGRVYTIHSVSLTSRDTGGANVLANRRLRKFTIIGFAYRVNTSDFSQNNPQLCSARYKNNGHMPASTTRKFDCTLDVRYIVINKTEPPNGSFWYKYLTLCEVEVEADCIRGFYTLMCPVSCSPGCAQVCDYLEGKCNLCIDGYYGDKCENQFDAENCAENCKSGCLTNGYCDGRGCKTGFHGNVCGKNCPENCVNAACDRESGFCDARGCKRGYYGDKCDKYCPSVCLNECPRDGVCTERFITQGKSSDDEQQSSLWLIQILILVGLLVLIVIILAVMKYKFLPRKETVQKSSDTDVDSLREPAASQAISAASKTTAVTAATTASEAASSIASDESANSDSSAGATVDPNIESFDTLV